MEKLLLTRKEAADALNISVDTLDEIHKAGYIDYFLSVFGVFLCCDYSIYH